MVNYKNQKYSLFPRLPGQLKLKIQSSDSNLTIMNVATEHTENESEFTQLHQPAVEKTLNTDLNKFLNRPVLIRTINWAEGASIDDSFSPWTTYFSHPSIMKRIDNYSFMRCKLNIRVLISASPFYYGAAQVSYKPYPSEEICTTSTTSSSYLVSRSQRPSFNIYPQKSMGGEMQLPFLFHKEYANITSTTDLNLLGSLYTHSFYDLMNANSVAGEAATIQIFAWAEDVELSGPTVKLALQSKDEYSGVISRPASSIAYWAGKLSGAPIIGQFATATSLASGAVASIASLFGYTNVPNIDAQAAFRPTSTPLLATTDISIATEKLTLDSKNELTIDNRAYSCGEMDPLIISNMCARESFLDSFAWDPTDAPQDLLWNCLVRPNLYRNISYTFGTTPATGNEITMIPMAMVANMFSYWRGDIKFRFVFIASAYHRGKVRIAWDPVGNLGSETDAYTEVFNKVVDLAEEQDVSIVIPYNQATAYLNTSNTPTAQTNMYSSTAITASPDANGLITMVVLNKTTSPVASADVKVLVYVSAVDMEFAGPAPDTNYYSPYQLQSKDCPLDNPSTNNLFETKGDTSHLNLNYMGEKILSLRQVLRRANHVMTLNCDNSFTGTTKLTSIIARMPIFPGYDASGITTAAKLGTAAQSANYNYVHFCNLNWVSQCFVGYRGSVIWNLNMTGPNPISTFSARRSTELIYSANYIVGDSISNTTESRGAYYGFIRNGNSAQGMSLTNGNAQPSLSILAPWYSKYKFALTSSYYRTLGRAAFGTTTDSVAIEAVVEGTTDVPASSYPIEYFVGIGTDFDPVFFLNVPVLYYTASLPIYA